jgi:large conductance mechanosensitive channel
MGALSEFRQFALRGNVVDMAVAFTVGVAFTGLVQSLVNDLIMPPIGLILGETDFSNLFAVLRDGPKAAPPYTTLAAAQAAGAVTLNYGAFINKLVALVLVALSMFLLIRLINRVHAKLEEEFGAAKPVAEAPATKQCPYCLTTVPAQATRCPACTSNLEAAPS